MRLMHQRANIKNDIMDTCDHHRRSLTMCQSEFSIQRRSIGKMNKQAASKFGSKYKATAMTYKGGMPFV